MRASPGGPAIKRKRAVFPEGFAPSVLASGGCPKIVVRPWKLVQSGAFSKREQLGWRWRFNPRGGRYIATTVNTRRSMR